MKNVDVICNKYILQKNKNIHIYTHIYNILYSKFTIIFIYIDVNKYFNLLVHCNNILHCACHAIHLVGPLNKANLKAVSNDHMKKNI